MKKAFTETYHISKTFNAPLGFVYRWCTDFQKDDLKMIGSKNRRNILERSSKRVIWAVVGDNGRGYDAVRVVWLHPPNAWHLDSCGDKHLVGDYRLTKLGRSRTRLNMKFTQTYYYAKKVEPKESWEAETGSEWDSYAKHLERDYRKYLRSTRRR